jgi:ABC-type iron transport system FetAB permease component
MMGITIVAYQKKKRSWVTPETAICAFYIIEVSSFTLIYFQMIVLMVFDLTGKYIIVLYFMIVASSYSSYALYYWVLA